MQTYIIVLVSAAFTHNSYVSYLARFNSLLIAAAHSLHLRAPFTNDNFISIRLPVVQVHIMLNNNHNIKVIQLISFLCDAVQMSK